MNVVYLPISFSFFFCSALKICIVLHFVYCSVWNNSIYTIVFLVSLNFWKFIRFFTTTFPKTSVDRNCGLLVSFINSKKKGNFHMNHGFYLIITIFVGKCYFCDCEINGCYTIWEIVWIWIELLWLSRISITDKLNCQSFENQWKRKYLEMAKSFEHKKIDICLSICCMETISKSQL